jgi:F420-0:gamma-glutamyl ligase-like protein
VKAKLVHEWACEVLFVNGKCSYYVTPTREQAREAARRVRKSMKRRPGVASNVRIVRRWKAVTTLEWEPA